MPQTGWCRDCGDWVYVQDDGSCPNGHGPECVDAVHTDTGSSGTATIASVGVGDVPPDFERFSWGAYLLMPLWGIVYGSSMVLGWWALTLATTLLIVSVFSSGGNPAAIAASSSISSVVQIGIQLWVGMNAYRWLWNKEKLRLAAVPDAKPRFRTTEFLAKQVRWLAAGATFTVLSLLGLAILGLSGEATAVATREQWGITTNEVMVAAVWTFAEIALAVWLARKMRAGDVAAPEGV
ncbi:MAG: hypothetical protein U1E26_01445 [Coriobacteriia bacterium]|nr:hypothetical protein [Coriobacteriia bacterium]